MRPPAAGLTAGLAASRRRRPNRQPRRRTASPPSRRRHRRGISGSGARWAELGPLTEVRDYVPSASALDDFVDKVGPRVERVGAKVSQKIKQLIK